MLAGCWYILATLVGRPYGGRNIETKRMANKVMRDQRTTGCHDGIKVDVGSTPQLPANSPMRESHI